MRRAPGPEDRTPLRTWHRVRTLGSQRARYLVASPAPSTPATTRMTRRRGRPSRPLWLSRVRSLPRVIEEALTVLSLRLRDAERDRQRSPHAPDRNTGGRLFATHSNN